MQPKRDDYRLENIANEHAIDASVFVPFVIVRLRAETAATEADLHVELRDITESAEPQRAVHFTWLSESAPSEPLAVQGRTITEWGACGIACALLPLYADLKISSVAAFGDRFDYWVRDQQSEFGLEVSGTVTGELEVRHDQKVKQLLDNPYGIDGYVVVVTFGTRRAIFSFHAFQEPST